VWPRLGVAERCLAHLRGRTSAVPTPACPAFSLYHGLSPFPGAGWDSPVTPSSAVVRQFGGGALCTLDGCCRALKDDHERGRAGTSVGPIIAGWRAKSSTACRQAGDVHRCRRSDVHWLHRSAVPYLLKFDPGSTGEDRVRSHRPAWWALLPARPSTWSVGLGRAISRTV